MSILVAKMFVVDVTEFQFVFSEAACIKTCIYFAIMYLAVMFFNTITVSRYKLINLLNANKKNEKIKIKNPFIAIIIFLIGASILGYAYWFVLRSPNGLSARDLIKPILLGIIGTIFIFWSLSGFILQVVQIRKKTYLKDANMFVLRQINSKINTTVISMSVICIMLFVTISILSSSLSLKNSLQNDLLKYTPVDINLEKTANLGDEYEYYGKILSTTEEQRIDSRVSIQDTMKNNGVDLSIFKEIVEIPIYGQDDLTFKDFLGEKYEETNAKYPFLLYSKVESILKISDYNKIAKLYGIEQYELNDDEYIVVCNYDNNAEVRNSILETGHELEIANKKYKPKNKECKNGFIEISESHTNPGIIVVPDSCEFKEENIDMKFFAANYNADTEEGKKEIESIFLEGSPFVNELTSKGINLDGLTKISLFEASVGISTIVIFIAIYLGIIFLIASAAILALKQLTESSDNKLRYSILRKIGCDEKIINKSLFMQIGVFFFMPLALALVHSIFGIQFAVRVLDVLVSSKYLIPSIIGTAIIILLIYGTYFLATYFESKNIISEDD